MFQVRGGNGNGGGRGEDASDGTILFDEEEEHRRSGGVVGRFANWNVAIANMAVVTTSANQIVSRNRKRISNGHRIER